MACQKQSQSQIVKLETTDDDDDDDDCDDDDDGGGGSGGGDDDDDDDDDVCIDPVWCNTSHTVVQWFSYLSRFSYFGSSSELIGISVTVSEVS